MQVIILSRCEAAQLLRQNGHSLPSDMNMISIRDLGQRRLHRDCDRILNLQFDDVLEGDKGAMTKEQAELVRDFALETLQQERHLVVHCNGGVSRSAACAAGIIEGIKHTTGATVGPDAHNIWFSSEYVPNEFVWELVCNQFGIVHTEDEIQDLVSKSRKYWFDHNDF